MDNRLFTFLSFLIVGLFFVLFAFFLFEGIDNDPYYFEKTEVIK